MEGPMERVGLDPAWLVNGLAAGAWMAPARGERWAAETRETQRNEKWGSEIRSDARLAFWLPSSRRLSGARGPWCGRLSLQRHCALRVSFARPLLSPVGRGPALKPLSVLRVRARRARRASASGTDVTACDARPRRGRVGCLPSRFDGSSPTSCRAPAGATRSPRDAPSTGRSRWLASPSARHACLRERDRSPLSRTRPLAWKEPFLLPCRARLGLGFPFRA